MVASIRAICDARSLVEYVVVYVGLAVLGPLFALLERRAPATPITRTRRARFVDLAYWIITPLFTGTLSRLLLLGIVGLVGLAAGFGTDGSGFLARVQTKLPFASLPFPAAFALALLVADFFGYVSHRLRHTVALWRLHAVHHCARGHGQPTRVRFAGLGTGGRRHRQCAAGPG